MTTLPKLSLSSRWAQKTAPPQPEPVGFIGCARRRRHRTITLGADTDARIDDLLIARNVNFSAWVRDVLEAELLRRGHGPKQK